MAEEDAAYLFADNTRQASMEVDKGALARAAALAAGREDWMDVTEVWWWKKPLP